MSSYHYHCPDLNIIAEVLICYPTKKGELSFLDSSSSQFLFARVFSILRSQGVGCLPTTTCYLSYSPFSLHSQSSLSAPTEAPYVIPCAITSPQQYKRSLLSLWIASTATVSMQLRATHANISHVRENPDVHALSPFQHAL